MTHEPAAEPNDLARSFVERANAGDLDGIVALFEPDAIVSGPGGDGVVTGHEAIRAKYAAVLARRPQFSLGNQQPAMINGDLALTSTWFDDADGGAAAEVARRQPDGTWLWTIDKGQIRGPIQR
ncbi:YybH family protein [Nucisporomicrobium flavum]|uniref:YybH family protein n=1 Tax=Nucisporomicrobium flavum TaxID=2785915 RepID=UPI0018F647FC|nr:nuclear transport factor 2 family protein [Nucisporomicrobium flavum]